MNRTENPTHATIANASSRIYCDDALKVLPALPPNSVDAVITDPPYGLDATGAMVGQVNRNYHITETHGRGYADNDPDAYLAWCERWIQECNRVLKPGGFFLSFAGSRTVDLIGFATRRAGFDIREQMTWVRYGGASRGLKVVRPEGQTVSSTICPAHEPIVCAQKRRDGTFAENERRWGVGFINVSASDRWTGETGPWPRTVFEYPKARRDERNPLPAAAAHPTVKPLALMRELVRLFVPYGGLVLDPFGGSGTTVEAAILEQRFCLAIERDPDFVTMIDARIQRAVHGDVTPRAQSARRCA